MLCCLPNGVVMVALAPSMGCSLPLLVKKVKWAVLAPARPGPGRPGGWRRWQGDGVQVGLAGGGGHGDLWFGGAGAQLEGDGDRGAGAWRWAATEARLRRGTEARLRRGVEPEWESEPLTWRT